MPLVQSDWKFLWSAMSLKRIICFLIFLCRVSHQEKLVPETTTFVWVWLGEPHIQPDCSILWSSISLEGIKYVSFFCLDLFITGRYHLGYHFWLVLASYVFRPIRLQDSLIRNIWKEPIDIFDFLDEGNHQEKVASKATTIGWMWPGVPQVNSDSRIIWSSVSLEGID